MLTRIGLCFLWCIVTVLAQSTTSQLATFYAKWSKSSFPGITANAIEAYLYGMDEFLRGDIASAKARVDAIFSQIGTRDPYQFLGRPSVNTADFTGGQPVAYSSLKMLKQVLDFAATKQISFADSAKRQHFTIVVAAAKCGVGTRASNLELTQKEQIRVLLDPRFRLNNYRAVRNSIQVFQAYLWAISKGAFVVDVVVKEIEACVTLSSSRSDSGRLNMGVLGADLWTYKSKNVDPVTTEADMVLFVYPTNRPTAQVFKDKRVEIITGGSLVGSRAISIMSDDSWFVEKPPHMGSGEWTEVERRTYLPQWYQHEVFHFLFYMYPQFKMEVKGHDWFDKSFWPSDFVHGPSYLEADYFSACVNQRFIPRLNPPLGVGLLTSLPTPNFVQTHWAAIAPTLAGTYVHTPTENGWHRVTITRSGTNTWVWKNAAGASWDLLWDSQKLSSASVGPYPSVPVSLKFVRNGQGFYQTSVTSLIFNSATYTRVTTVSNAVLDDSPNSNPDMPLNLPNISTTLILLFVVFSTLWTAFFTWKTVSVIRDIRKSNELRP